MLLKNHDYLLIMREPFVSCVSFLGLYLSNVFNYIETTVSFLSFKWNPQQNFQWPCLSLNKQAMISILNCGCALKTGIPVCNGWQQIVGNTGIHRINIIWILSKAGFHKHHFRKVWPRTRSISPFITTSLYVNFLPLFALQKTCLKSLLYRLM